MSDKASSCPKVAAACKVAEVEKQAPPSSPGNGTGAASKQKKTPSPDMAAGQASSEDLFPPPESPGSKKRALPDPSTEAEPSPKKAKAPSSMVEIEEHASPDSDTKDDNDSSPPPASDLKISKENWQGFCEIESDPAYFSVILREMGVKDVAVREVFAMDPAILNMVPHPIHGLIFLFRYREFGNEDQAADAPEDVWFCNQLPAQNSCGTLAMLNIIMNKPELDIGEHLVQFKDFTQDMSSVQRGEALASFDFVKQIHNSFAKRMDILENDKHLAAKARRAERLKEQAKKGKSRRNSAESAASEDSTDSFEENGHHFIAFVPVGGEVWKLDGMDAQPTCVGTFDAAVGETWLSAASDTINTLMAAGDSDYGVLAVSQSPLSSLREKAALTINTLVAVESRLHEVDPTWVSSDPPPSPSALGIEQQLLARHPVHADTMALVAVEDSATLLARRSALAEELGGVVASIGVEMDEEAAEEQKARQRRFDAGPVLKKWLEMLAGNGYLEDNLDRFMEK
jgi:ubiquitin carboxyl-terminal hydrolase L5